MVTATTAKGMVIELLSADQSLCGHLTSLQGEITMDTIIIGITIPGRVVITVRSMDIFLRIALEHTLVATKIGGSVKPHASVV